MVLPVEGGLLALVPLGFFGVGAILCSALVLTPFVISWRRRRREPQAWGDRGLWIATGIILVINGLMFSTAFVLGLMR